MNISKVIRYVHKTKRLSVVNWRAIQNKCFEAWVNFHNSKEIICLNVHPSLNTQSKYQVLQWRPLWSTFTFENVRSPKKKPVLFHFYAAFYCGRYSIFRKHGKKTALKSCLLMQDWVFKLLVSPKKSRLKQLLTYIDGSY